MWPTRTLLAATPTYVAGAPRPPPAAQGRNKISCEPFVAVVLWIGRAAPPAEFRYFAIATVPSGKP